MFLYLFAHYICLEEKKKQKTITVLSSWHNTLWGGSLWKYVISPTSGPTSANRCWIFFLSSSSLFTERDTDVSTPLPLLVTADPTGVHFKGDASVRPSSRIDPPPWPPPSWPDLQPVVLGVQSERLLPLLEQVDLHVAQGLLQLCSLSFALSHLPLQFMLCVCAGAGAG